MDMIGQFWLAKVHQTTTHNILQL